MHAGQTASIFRNEEFFFCWKRMGGGRRKSFLRNWSQWRECPRKKREGKVRNDGWMAGGVEGGGIRRFLCAKVPRIPSKLLYGCVYFLKLYREILKCREKGGYEKGWVGNNQNSNGWRRHPLLSPFFFFFLLHRQGHYCYCAKKVKGEKEEAKVKMNFAGIRCGALNISYNVWWYNMNGGEFLNECENARASYNPPHQNSNRQSPFFVFLRSYEAMRCVGSVPN